MNNKLSIIYIAGYGRSGSTLLERILSSNQFIFGLGEVKYLFKNIHSKNNYCSCGKTITTCPYWKNVIDDLKDQKNYKKLYEEQKIIESFSPVINFKKKNIIKEQYLKKLQTLYKTIMEQTPDNTKYIIDSSKTARDAFFRPFMLSKYFNVKIIHLIRDGRGCMWSNIKGSNRKMEMGMNPKQKHPVLKTALSWPLANLSPLLYKYKYSNDNYIKIKYEDFIDNPENVLKNIENFISIDLKPQINMLLNKENVPKGHQLAGNRLRKRDKIILKKDEEWKNKLSPFQKLIFWLLDWPIAIKNGYHKNK